MSRFTKIFKPSRSAMLNQRRLIESDNYSLNADVESIADSQSVYQESTAETSSPVPKRQPSQSVLSAESKEDNTFHFHKGSKSSGSGGKNGEKQRPMSTIHVTGLSNNSAQNKHQSTTHSLSNTNSSAINESTDTQSNNGSFTENNANSMPSQNRINTRQSRLSSSVIFMDQVEAQNNLPVLKLTAEQVQLIKTSWESSLSELFASHQFWNDIYNTASLIDPELKNRLPHPDHQVVHFTGILRMVVMNCSDLSSIVEYLQGTGRRHGILYGAEPHDFQVLGIAVFKSIDDKLAEKMSLELEDSWISLFCYVANVMIESCNTIKIPGGQEIEADYGNDSGNGGNLSATPSYLLVDAIASEIR